MPEIDEYAFDFVIDQTVFDLVIPNGIGGQYYTKTEVDDLLEALRQELMALIEPPE